MTATTILFWMIGQLSTIFSHGDGTFPVDNTIEEMGIAAFDMLADDFNGDGAADIMTIAQDGPSTLLPPRKIQ